MKERDGSYGCHLCQKKNTRCDRSYRCCLCLKTKRKNAMDRIGLHQNKTGDMTDSIGAVYAQRQNERTRQIIWVLSTPNKTRDMTDHMGRQR